MFSSFSVMLFISNGYNIGCEFQVKVASPHFVSTISIRLFLYYFLLLHTIIQIFSLILKILIGCYLLLLLFKHNQAIPYHTAWRLGNEERQLLMWLMPALSGIHPCSSLSGVAVRCKTQHDKSEVAYAATLVFT